MPSDPKPSSDLPLARLQVEPGFAQGSPQIGDVFLSPLKRKQEGHFLGSRPFSTDQLAKFGAQFASSNKLLVLTSFLL